MAESSRSEGFGPGGWLPPEAPGARPYPSGKGPAPPARGPDEAARDDAAPWDGSARPATDAGAGEASTPEPGNDAAVAGFVLAVSGLALLAISFGLLFVVSLPCAVLGIVFGTKGKRKVAAGHTERHASLAQAAFLLGCVGLALSLLAVAALIALVAFDSPLVDEFQRSFEERLRRQAGG